jgi:hypothetical protein
MFQEPEAKPKRKNIGAIVGGLVGGVVGLLLICAAVYCLRRRRPRAVTRESSGSYFEVDEAHDTSTVASSPTESIPTKAGLLPPGFLPPGARPPSEPAWHGPHATLPPYAHASPPRIDTEASPTRAGTVESPTDSPTDSPTRPSPTETVGSDPAKAQRRPRRPRPAARPVVQEDDGGTLLPEFVPPRYNPEWAVRRETRQLEQQEWQERQERQEQQEQ